MSRDGSGGEERQLADEDLEWLETTNASDSSALWRRLLKDTGLGVVALLCLLSYIYWPHPWVVATGVAVVVSLAWLSEMRSCDSQLPANSRTVIITGCDTGTVKHLSFAAS